jgi:hypothetical protein
MMSLLSDIAVAAADCYHLKSHIVLVSLFKRGAVVQYNVEGHHRAQTAIDLDEPDRWYTWC